MCNVGGNPIGSDHVVVVREILCGGCGRRFYVCQSCWRGQSYCSDACRDAAQGEAHREAQRRYRRTEKGRTAHCKGEKRRRMGLSGKESGEIVDDEGSTPQCSCTTMEASAASSDEGRRGCEGNAPMGMARCHFCGSVGVIVDVFPRRGYGKQHYTVNGERGWWWKK